MKIGARAHDFGCYPPQELAQKLKASGVQAVQLAIPKAIQGVGSYAQVNDALLAEIRQAFQQNAIEISVLGCYIEPSLPKEDERAKQLEVFREGLRCAAALGAGCIATETTPFTAPESERPKALDILRRSLNTMLTDAARLGVTVAVEPVASHTMNSVEITAHLLQEFSGSGLRTIFDPVNLLTPARVEEQETLWNEALAAFGESIMAMHIKDAVAMEQKLVPALLWQGVMRYKNIFTWLKKYKPEMALLREEIAPETADLDFAVMRKWASL